MSPPRTAAALLPARCPPTLPLAALPLLALPTSLLEAGVELGRLAGRSGAATRSLRVARALGGG